MNKNIIKVIVLSLVFLSTLFASSNNEKISVQLLWKHQFEFAGFYMAKEKGFYKEAGLDVQIKEYDFGINITKDVESGVSTYGVNYPSVIMDRANGHEVILLSAILQSSPHALASLKGSGIETIKDFKNKRVMLTDSSVNAASLSAMVNSQQVSFDEMKKLKHRFNIEDLIHGKTDLMTVFTSNEIYELKEKGLEYDIWDPKDYGFDLYDDIVFTSKKEMTNNPKRVERFLNATLKGWRYAFENIDESVKLILTKYNSQNKTKGALEYEAKVLKQLAYYKSAKLGVIDNNKIQRIYDLYNIMGLTKHKIDLDTFIYEYIKKRLVLTNEEKEFIKNNPVIKVHNETNWPPYNFNENNIPKGFAVDYVKLLASKFNLEIDFVNGPSWSEFMEMTKNGQIDAMINIVRSNEREKHLTFTDPYMRSSKSIFTNLKGIKALEDLNGKTVAVPKDFFIHKFLAKHYPKIKLNIYKDTLQCIYSVVEGNSDALVDHFGVVNYLMKKNGVSIGHVSIVKDERLKIDLRIAFEKNNIVLRNIFQKAMDQLDESQVNLLKNKWFGVNIEERLDSNYIEFTSSEEKYLDEKKKINMCIDPDWMPFEKIENGKHIGLTADYYDLFEKTIGINIELVKTKNWSESLEFAKERKCDILSLAMETPSRQKYMNFTSAYLKVPLVLATKLDVGFITDFKALKGEKIGIPKGYAFVEILKNKYPNINIIEVDNLTDGLEKVNSGRLFGYIGTLASVGYAFQHQFTGELKIAGKFDDNWELGIAVRNDDTILLNILQKAIDNLAEDTHQNILNKWVSIKYERGVDYTLLWQMLGVIAIVLIFVAYRQYILKQSNKDLKKAVDEKTKELQELNKDLELRVKKAVEENSKKDRILFEQSKMASMGEMIGNIAHQWRQPLSVISTAASGIQLKIEHDIFEKDEIIKNLEHLEQSAQYLSHTIDDFQNFLKPTRKKKIFNIKDIINKNVEMFGKSFINNDIELIINTQSIDILGNENELLQVIINITNNAKDALKDQKIEEKLVFIDLYKKDKKAVIDIKDNAGGINKDIMANIFDAYFTTKHKSQGTGLGLYMSYQIVTTSFEGTIKADNISYDHNEKCYVGARFQIILPIEAQNKEN